MRVDDRAAHRIAEHAPITAPVERRPLGALEAPCRSGAARGSRFAGVAARRLGSERRGTIAALCQAGSVARMRAGGGKIRGPELRTAVGPRAGERARRRSVTFVASPGLRAQSSPALRLLLENLCVAESGEDQAAVAEYLFGPERRRGLTGAFFMAASCPNPRPVAEILTENEAADAGGSE